MIGLIFANFVLFVVRVSLEVHLSHHTQQCHSYCFYRLLFVVVSHNLCPVSKVTMS